MRRKVVKGRPSFQSFNNFSKHATRCSRFWFGLLALVGLLITAPGSGQIFESVTPEGCPNRGAVADEIEPASSFMQAGGQRGDVAVAWRRLPSPPANPEPASGPIASVFDWLWLGVEQAPRGPLEIDIERDGVPMTLRLQPGLWEQYFTPRLPKAAHDIWFQDWSELHVEQGREELDKLVEAAKDSGDLCIQVWALLNRGVILAGSGATEETQSDLRAATDLAPSLYARSLGWVAQASHAKNIGNLEAAIDGYEKAYRTRVEHGGEHSLAAAEALGAIAAISSSAGRIEEANPILEQVLTLQETLAPGSLIVADTMGNLAVNLGERGRREEARDLHERALKMTERLAPGSLGHASGLLSLAGLLHEAGDLGEAVTLVETAVEIYDSFEILSIDWITGLNMQGILYADLGELEAAFDSYSRALELMRKAGYSGPPELALLNNLGTLYNVLGDSDQARRHYQEALDLAAALELENDYVAGVRRNFSSILAEEGDFEDAESELFRAIEVYRRRGKASTPEAMALVSLGLLYEEWKQDWARAEELYRRSIGIMEEVAPESQQTAYAHYAMGRLALRNEDLALAARHSRKALDIRRRVIPETEATAETLHLIAEVELAGSQPDLAQARAWLRESLDIIEAQLLALGGTARNRTLFRERLRVIYQAAVVLELELENEEAAFQILDGSRARAFLERFTVRKLGFLNSLPVELSKASKKLSIEMDWIYHELLTLEDDANEAVIGALHARLDEAKVDARALRYQIERASPKLAALRFPKVRTVHEMQAELDPGTLVLSYSVGEDATTLFVLSHWALEVYRIETGEAEIHGKGRALLEAIDTAKDPRSSWAGTQARLLDQLGDELIGPVAHELECFERVLVLADGPLQLLPWAALRTDGRYLVEQTPIVQAGSLTAYLESVRARPSTVRHQRWEGFGDITYPREASKTRAGKLKWTQLKRLPATRRELEAIAEVVDIPVGLHLGAEATEERFQTVAEKATILHLAAHGFVDERDPLDSFIAFAVPETFDESGDNGLLHAWEIFDQLRLDAELVVLSACETARGSDEGGEGLAGLARAFRYAGARSVVGSLWQVDDDSTAELMSELYRRLAEDSRKDSALRAAQLALIQGEHPKYRMPYYWAAFQLYGDWR